MASPTGHSLCLYGHHYSREKLVWKKDLRLLYPALSYHVAIDLCCLATYCGTDVVLAYCCVLCIDWVALALTLRLRWLARCNMT